MAKTKCRLVATKEKLNNNNGSDTDNIMDVALVLETKYESSHFRLLVVFIGCCMLHFMTFGMHYSFGAMFASLLEEYHAGQGKTAWVGSLASGSLFFWSMLSVKMCDITSITFTCLCGSVISGIGLVATSFVHQFQYLYLTHSFLFGLGTSLMYTPSLIVIARWFGRYTSLATGFVVASASFGQVVLSPLLQYMMESQGVLKTFRLWGSVFLTATVLSSLSFFLLEERCSSDPTEPKHAKYQIKWKLFTNKAYIVWIITMMISNFTYYIPLIHLSHYAKHVGASPKESSLLLTAIASSSILGRLLFGKLSNHKPKMTMQIYQFAMFCSGVLTLFFSMSTKFWHLITYSLLYGFLDGSFIGLMSIVTIQIVGVEDIGQGWGMMLLSIALPIALGPPTVGWMNESDSIDGRALFYLSGLPMVFGACLLFLVRRWENDNTSKRVKQAESIDESSFILQVVTVL
eukprot:gene10723-11871_t